MPAQGDPEWFTRLLFWEGYVPNVVYSCGSMIHGDDLLLPHGLTDTTSRIVRLPIEPLLARLVG